jgi:hypothetical protein
MTELTVKVMFTGMQGTDTLEALETSEGAVVSEGFTEAQRAYLWVCFREGYKSFPIEGQVCDGVFREFVEI